MKPKNYEVLMDIYMGVLNAPAIQFTTEDFGMCQITFSLLEDRITPYNLSNCLVRMVINGQQQDCTISDANNGKAEIVLLQSMFSEVGPVFAELQIYDATNQTMRLTTPTFKYTVRKSLMDDNTVQAAPNFSILQNMILEVSSADEVAKQAKKTAESAMATANQAESKANQIMANGDYAKEQGDYAKAEGDRLQGMLTIDGTAQTNFDFIKNQVEQDGLIEYVNKKITGAHVVNKLDISNDFTLVGCIRNYNKTTLWYVPNVGQMRLVVDAQSNKLTINGFEDRRILETDATPIIEFAMIKQGSRFTISINGIIAVTDLKYADEDIINKWNTNKFSFGYNNATLEVEYTCNNRALAQQEIQHIFSVINNTPSIKELHTTNAEGETSILRLASDTDHVEDRSGRTQDQINRTFYKRMCKEIPSPNGEPITVKNGEEGYVLSAEIKGQTVKNYIHTENALNVPTSSNYEVKKSIPKENTSGLISGKKYRVIFNVIENTCVSSAYINNAGGGCFIEKDVFVTAGWTGIKEEIMTYKDLNKPIIECYMPLQESNKKIVYTVTIVDENIVCNPLEAGLNSTQAVINNNGQSYPIYATEEDKANKKVILLGGVGDVKDTLEILEDGSGVITYNTNQQVLNGDENWTLVDGNTSNFFRITNTEKKNTCISDRLPTPESISSSNDDIGITCNSGTDIRARLVMGKAMTLEQFKADLRSNPIVVRYNLNKPIVTHIPKELVPTILTHKTNIWEVGGAVKASSFKIVQPVDAVGELRAEINEIKKQLGAVAALQLDQIN